MKKTILIGIFIALMFSFLSLFSVSIKPALSLYGEVYSHVVNHSFYNYGTPLLPGSHISSFETLKGEISQAILPWLPEPPLPDNIIIRESGIEKNFTSQQEKKSPGTNPSDQ